MTNAAVVTVTGGSGYIAGFCIQQLLAEGHTVRATLRSLTREQEVRAAIGGAATDPQRLSFVAADLGADAGWADAMAGATYVLHVASPIPTVNPKSDDELVRPARDGTLRALKAAKAAGVRRVVVTSSTAAVCYGHGSYDTPRTEADWSNPDNRADSSAYERSKTLAERAAWDFMAKEVAGMEMATVNPGAVLGPVMGRDFSASLEIVRQLMAGEVPGCPRMGWPLVDVRDIADLHVRAMTHPAAAGERFLGAGDFLWMTDIAAVLKQRMGGRARRVPSGAIPNFVVRLASLGNPTVGARLFELGKHRPVSNTKAKSVLGWAPRPLGDTIVDCAESLIAAGIVRAG